MVPQALATEVQVLPFNAEQGGTTGLELPPPPLRAPDVDPPTALPQLLLFPRLPLPSRLPLVPLLLLVPLEPSLHAIDLSI